MSLARWFLPAEGRLSADDLLALALIGAAFPREYRVALVHPARHELHALPGVDGISERRWDLSYRLQKPYDALIIGRLPALGAPQAFRSALASCRVLVVLDDATEPWRGAPLLSAHGSVRVYRGELTDPLLRVDDYPTGVRPILEDLSLLHEVLTQIDQSGLVFHLGVVPAILEERMLPFLRGLEHLVVSMHGYEHAYEKSSRILIAANDPFNERGTVSGFDEFAGRSYEEILDKLRAGLDLLESRIGVRPLSYIPPCNQSNRNTGRALVAAGFELVLSEKVVPGCALPSIASDFYDRSSAFRPGSGPAVSSLHATWEADMLRAGDSQSLPKFLSSLLAQRSSAREQAASVAQRLIDALARG